jgi:D-alanyl-lipoteichoic acid acyltransferase DltB (MBOAT superfamily)
MLFNSIVFVAFMSVVFLVYPRLSLRRQNVFLLAASYVFYGYWDWRFNLLLLISTAVSFLAGKRIHASEEPKQRKLLLSVCVIMNLGILASFKYFNFFVESAAALLTTIGFQPHIPVLRVILPVGISFYTFQTMSYVIDVYRGNCRAEENIVNFALFVSFFPQLVAGPIERATNILPQLSKPRKVTTEKVLEGLNLVLLGYFKKVAIADTLGPMVESIFSTPGEASTGQLWTGVYAFTFQIYGDFSGYTDIARGISRMLGVELMENFNAPYLSRNITEFWRRWHISLSTWLRDYLYIPLGGNRAGKARTYRNLLITMLLAGLWHGAAWNFVLWGLLHGIYLAAHRMFLKGGKVQVLPPSGLIRRTADFFRMVFTFHLVAVSWVLFRSNDLAGSWIYIRRLFSRFAFPEVAFPVVFAASLMIALDVLQTYFKSHTWLTDRKSNHLFIVKFSFAQIMLVSTVSAAIAHIQTVRPFIYFQF